MQLKEYIALVVEDIFEGITTLQAKYNEKCQINPPVVSPSLADSDQKVCFIDNVGYCIETINFDVVLLAEETTSTEQGGGVSLKIANVKAAKGGVNSNLVSQRVTFPIRVVYPSISTNKEPQKQPIFTGSARLTN